jgi:hypothetical protein
MRVSIVCRACGIAVGLACAILLQSGASAEPVPDGVVLADPTPLLFSQELKDTQRRAAAIEDQPYLVDIGARLVQPSRATTPDFSRGPARLFIQFSETLRRQDHYELAVAGVEFQQPYGPFTYLAVVQPEGFEALIAHPLYRGAAKLEKADRLAPDLTYRKVRSHAITPEGRVAAIVKFHDDVGLAAALVTAKQAGLIVPDSSRLLLDNRLVVEGSYGQLEKLAESPLVLLIEPVPPPGRDDNVNAAAMSNIDDIQGAPYFLDGATISVGQWEGGNPLATHQDLTPRVTVIKPNVTGDHATHVAGTIISSGANNAAAMGMAFAANLFSYSNQPNAGTVATEMSLATIFQGISAANHSWGLSDTDGYNAADADLFGRYESQARGWDLAIGFAGLVVGNSSGNDNDDCDGGGNCDGILGNDGNFYDTIDTAACAKNNITVGNLNDDAVTIAGSSSTGPMDDGRIKPDLVANGDSLLSTCFDDANPGNNAVYCSKGGTSMATPTIVGGMTLLHEHFTDLFGAAPEPETLKAVAVNTATDLGLPGPDYTYGHGLFDALACAQVIDLRQTRIQRGVVEQGETMTFKAQVPPGQPELRLTLAWTDTAGPAKLVPSPAPDLVNNLDLLAMSPNGAVTAFPFSGPNAGQLPNAALVGLPATATGPNNVDNVEHLRVANPQSGFWTVTVRGISVPSEVQRFALVSNVPFYLPDEPDIRVSAPTSYGTVCPGSFKDILVTIFNVGGGPLEVHAVEIISGAPEFQVLIPPVQPFMVQPGSLVYVTVRFTPLTPGMHTGTVRIRSNDMDEPEILEPLMGRGGAPEIVATLEGNMDFGDVCLRSFRDLNVQLTNTGTCDLSILNVTRVSGSAEFKLPGVLTFPLVIPPSTSIDVPIRYEPGNYGSDGAMFKVTSDDPVNGTISFPTTGNSPAPQLEISPCPVEFGEVCPDDAAAHEKIVFICNTGMCPILIPANGIRFEPPTTEFEVMGPVNYPISIAAGSECYPLTIRFTPTSAGDKSATLLVEGENGITQSCTVTGTLVSLEGGLSVTRRLAFPPTVISSNGPCGSELHLAITNVLQNCSIPVTGLTITGPDAGAFRIVGAGIGDPAGTLPAALLPGEELGDGALKVRFEPTQLVAKRFMTAQVNVTYITDAAADPPVEETLVVPMAGEPTQTGMRILITSLGVPVTDVARIQVRSATGPQTFYRPLQKLKNVAGPAGFEDVLGFQYHTEFGGISSPNQRLTGNYRVTATIRVGRMLKTRYVNFSVDTCTFNDTLKINF